MERKGWDLSGRAALRLDGVIVGTADPELFNMPLMRLPALCAWAVTFPIASWRGDLESRPLQAHTLDAALDEVEALYPLAPWWWPVRRLPAPGPRPYGVLSAEVAPHGSSDIEQDVWWIVGKLPVRVTAENGVLTVQVQNRHDENRLQVSGNEILCAPSSRVVHERRASTVAWRFCGSGVIKAAFTGDYSALQTLLKRHPAVWFVL